MCFYPTPFTDCPAVINFYVLFWKRRNDIKAVQVEISDYRQGWEKYVPAVSVYIGIYYMEVLEDSKYSFSMGVC